MLDTIECQKFDAAKLVMLKDAENLRGSSSSLLLEHCDDDCQFVLVPVDIDSQTKNRPISALFKSNRNRICEIKFFVDSWTHDSVNDLVVDIAVGNVKWMANTGCPSQLRPIKTTKSYFYVHVFCSTRKTTSASKAKFFALGLAGSGCNAIEGAFFFSRNYEKSAIFAGDSHVWQMNSPANSSRSEWCSPARKTENHHLFDRYRIVFSTAKATSFSKFSNRLGCFFSYSRSFSAHPTSNWTLFLNSNMRPIAGFIFEIVSPYVRFRMIFQGLGAEFQTSLDSFGHEDSLTESPSTMLSGVENVIKTSSYVGAVTLKFRCKQQVHALYTDWSCRTSASQRQLTSHVLSGVNHG